MKNNWHVVRHLPAGFLAAAVMWMFLGSIAWEGNLTGFVIRMICSVIGAVAVAFIFESVTNGKGQGVFQVMNDEGSKFDITCHIWGVLLFVLVMMIATIKGGLL